MLFEKDLKILRSCKAIALIRPAMISVVSKEVETVKKSARNVLKGKGKNVGMSGK